MGYFKFSLSFTKILCISYLPFMVFLVSCLDLLFLSIFLLTNSHWAQFWLIKSGDAKYYNTLPLKICLQKEVCKRLRPPVFLRTNILKKFWLVSTNTSFLFTVRSKFVFREVKLLFNLDIINKNELSVSLYSLAAISHQLIGSFHHNFEPFQINRDPDKRVLIDS